MVRAMVDPHAGYMEPHVVDDPLRTPTARPPVRRSTTDRHLGGVSTAVARYLGVSVTVARVGLVASVLVGGLGLAVYAAVWLFVPDDEGRVLIHGRSASSSESILAAILTGVAALVVTSWITRDGPSWFVSILVTVGVFILSRRDADLAPPAAGPPTVPPTSSPAGPPPAWSPPPTPPTPTAFPAPPNPTESLPTDSSPAESLPTDSSPVGETAVLSPLEDRTAMLSLPTRTPVTVVAPPAPRPPKPPKPMAFLGPLTVSIAVALAGSLMLLHAVGAIELRPSDVCIMVLAVIGLGLLVSTWFGRARGLIVLGLLLVPIVAVTAVADRIDFRGGVGDRTWAPEAPGDVRASYRLGAGAMQLDLTRLDPGTTDEVRTEMSLGAGQVQVVVPQDWSLDIDSDVDIGTVWFYDNGVRLTPDTPAPTDDGTFDSETRYDLIGTQDWFFPDRTDVVNDGRSSSGNRRSLHVDGVEGAPTLDVDLQVTAGVVEVFRVQS